MSQPISTETTILLKVLLACTRLVVAVHLRHSATYSVIPLKGKELWDRALNESSSLVGNHVIAYTGLDKVLEANPDRNGKKDG
jgi:hypothetical protein